jgi:hypothetical protein
VDKCKGRSRIAVAKPPAGYELCFRINRNPQPNIASARDLLGNLLCDVLLLAVTKTPKLVKLNSMASEITKRTILIILSNRTNFNQNTHDGFLCHSRHADGRTN